LSRKVGSLPGPVARPRCRVAAWVVSIAVAIISIGMDPNHTLANQAAATPPVAKRQPKDVSVHGERRVDDYHWLRERTNPEVISYLNAENAYTQAMLKHTEPLRQTLYDEMVSRIKETDESVPTRIDDYFYYTRTVAGKQYGIHCRKRRSLDAPEEVVLDENALAEGHAYFALGAFAVSPDHLWLAYSTDTTGAEAFALHTKNLETGELMPDAITNTYFGVEWANDSRTFFYTVLDQRMRPHRLMRHSIGKAPAGDAVLHQEDDPAFFVGVTKTKTRKFILMNLGSNTTTEVHFLDADDPGGAFNAVEPRRPEIEYYVEHHVDAFFILTNEGAKNFKVVEAPVATPGRDHWREVVPHRNAVKIDDIDVFRNHLVVYERENGLKQIMVMRLDAGESHHVRFREPAYTLWTGENPDFEAEELRYNYTSLVTPRTVIDYNMRTRSQRMLKRYEVLGGYEPGHYVTERIFAAAADGTRVPISLVYKDGTPRDGSAPLFLYGYGAYGVSIEPYFISNRLSLVDRGVIYAIAHIRGGGAMGRQWYDRGKLLNKRNTFTDFLACADHLIEKGYASPGRIACSGGSAGGMLIGVAANMRPELWGGVVAHVPFVDVVNTMLDESIPLTVIEYEEWGDPRDKKFYEYIRSYSPYDNVRKQDYPPMLVTAGMNDPRVQYWEPAKWVARLRALKTDGNPLLLKVRMNEGHVGASGRYDYLRDVGLEYGFVLDCFGIKE